VSYIGDYKRFALYVRAGRVWAEDLTCYCLTLGPFGSEGEARAAITTLRKGQQ
jgi:hypothetical protein